MYAMGINQASLVEKYESEIKETNFVYTCGYETYAFTRLGKFCQFMEDFFHDANLKKQFMKCSVDDDDEVERINKMLLEKLDLKHMKNAKVTPIKDVITTPEPTPEPSNDKYIIVMDCETNGRIKERGIRPTPTNLHKFPRIVQFSWGIYTETG